MEATEAAAEIRRIIRNELDGCESAISRDDKQAASNDLQDAVRKLQRIADRLESEAE